MVGSRCGQGLLLLLTVIQLWIILLLVIRHMVIRANQGFRGWNHCAVVVVGSGVDYGNTGYGVSDPGVQRIKD